MNRLISRKEFQKEVIDSIRVSLVQFRIEWSGACQIISPMYEELAVTYRDQVNFFTVDVEIETGFESEFGIVEIPTILFFKCGSVIDHIIGLVPRNLMITKIENALNKELN